MGYYLNPPEKVVSVGRYIEFSSGYAAAARQLRKGEVLVGVFDRIIFKRAPWLHSEREWREFFDQYGSGMSVNAGVYAVDIAKANEMGAHIPEERAA